MGVVQRIGGVLAAVGNELSERPEAPFRAMLERHFGRDPSTLPLVSEAFRPSDMPNLQTAVAGLLAAGRAHEVHGVTAEYDYVRLSLATLVSTGATARGLFVGPVSYLNVALADGVLACAQNALYLVRDRGRPFALLVAHTDRGYRSSLGVEVMSGDRAHAEGVLAELRTAMRAHNVYRGHVVSLAVDGQNNIAVSFHRLPQIARDGVVLPAETLARVERQSFAVTKHRDELLKSGRHLKRGMLLYGPPGTGKTLTAMYLAAQMKGRTVLLATGRQQGLINACCSMARLLQPSTVILEDVDLIGENRETSAPSCSPVLFDLLNEMDGLREDADVLFVLTTNRPEALEPALAARPGRVDLAVEVPLPDAECRRRLIELYARGLTLSLASVESLVQRTEGVSGAFLKELMRRAALVAADAGCGSEVRDEHMEDALRELLSDRDVLTRSLLGAKRAVSA